MGVLVTHPIMALPVWQRLLTCWMAESSLLVGVWESLQSIFNDLGKGRYAGRVVASIVMANGEHCQVSQMVDFNWGGGANCFRTYSSNLIIQNFIGVNFMYFVMWKTWCLSMYLVRIWWPRNLSWNFTSYGVGTFFFKTHIYQTWFMKNRNKTSYTLQLATL